MSSKCLRAIGFAVAVTICTLGFPAFAQPAETGCQTHPLAGEETRLVGPGMVALQGVSDPFLTDSEIAEHYTEMVQPVTIRGTRTTLANVNHVAREFSQNADAEADRLGLTGVVRRDFIQEAHRYWNFVQEQTLQVRRGDAAPQQPFRVICIGTRFEIHGGDLPPITLARVAIMPDSAGTGRFSPTSCSAPCVAIDERARQAFAALGSRQVAVAISADFTTAYVFLRATHMSARPFEVFSVRISDNAATLLAAGERLELFVER